MDHKILPESPNSCAAETKVMAAEEKTQTGALQLNILTLNGCSYKIQAEDGWTVRHVKEQLLNYTGIAPHQQKLLHGADLLCDFDVLRDTFPGRQSCDLFVVMCCDEEKTRLIAAMADGFCRVPEKYIDDVDVVLAAVQKYGMQLEHAPSFKHNKQVVLAAVKQNGFALSFAGKEFAKDQEVILAAVKSSSFSFTLADENLQKDVDFAMQALSLNSCVYDWLPADIQKVLKKQKQEELHKKRELRRQEELHMQQEFSKHQLQSEELTDLNQDTVPFKQHSHEQSLLEGKKGKKQRASDLCRRLRRLFK